MDFLIDIPFEVNHIGHFINVDGKTIVAKRDCSEIIPIGVSECTGGYIRSSGVENYTRDDVGYEDSYVVREEMNLVVWTDKYTIESLKYFLLERIPNIKRIVKDKSIIMREEFMDNNEMNLLKIVFDYKDNYFKNCENELECIC